MAGPPDELGRPEPEVMYCVNHPRRETLIRCSKCLAPICTRCAVQTPVGQRCYKCANAGRAPLCRVGPGQLLVALAVSLGLAVLAGAVMAQLGLLFTLFLAAPAGGIVAEAVLRSTRGKRGRLVQIVTGLAIVMGAAVGPWIWAALAAGGNMAFPTHPVAYLGSLLRVNSFLYAVLAVGTAVARLR